MKQDWIFSLFVKEEVDKVMKSKSNTKTTSIEADEVDDLHYSPMKIQTSHFSPQFSFMPLN